MKTLQVYIEGDWSNTKRYFKSLKKIDITPILLKYGEIGVIALRQATPKDTGKTSQSWSYQVTSDYSSGKFALIWKNSNVVDHVNIALIIQHGHGTKNGVYVSGIDYINPALESVFERIAEEIWKEVIRK